MAVMAVVDASHLIEVSCNTQSLVILWRLWPLGVYPILNWR